jgi:hypothetical protein
MELGWDLCLTQDKISLSWKVALLNITMFNHYDTKEWQEYKC